MNTLDHWRQENGLSAKALAKLLQTTQTAVSRYLRGDRIPTREMMSRIYLLTHGRVTPNSFYRLPSLGRPRRRPAAAAQ